MSNVAEHFRNLIDPAATDPKKRAAMQFFRDLLESYAVARYLRQSESLVLMPDPRKVNGLGIQGALAGDPTPQPNLAAISELHDAMIGELFLHALSSPPNPSDTSVIGELQRSRLYPEAIKGAIERLEGAKVALEKEAKALEARTVSRTK